MIEGIFQQNLPFVSIALGWTDKMMNSVFLVDTGFTGDLQVTNKVAEKLGLESLLAVPVKMADGSSVSMPTALAFAALEGETQHVTVQISNSLPLIGIGLLTKFGYKAIVDCKHRTVALDKVI